MGKSDIERWFDERKNSCAEKVRLALLKGHMFNNRIHQVEYEPVFKCTVSYCTADSTALSPAYSVCVCQLTKDKDKQSCKFFVFVDNAPYCEGEFDWTEEEWDELINNIFILLRDDND